MVESLSWIALPRPHTHLSTLPLARGQTRLVLQLPDLRTRVPVSAPGCGARRHCQSALSTPWPQAALAIRGGVKPEASVRWNCRCTCTSAICIGQGRAGRLAPVLVRSPGPPPTAPLRYTDGRLPGAGKFAISMGNAQEGQKTSCHITAYPRPRPRSHGAVFRHSWELC